MNSEKAKEEYFCGKDWTGVRALKTLQKSSARRRAFPSLFVASRVAAILRSEIDLPDGQPGDGRKAHLLRRVLRFADTSLPSRRVGG
jgi:hypothetical protein